MSGSNEKTTALVVREVTLVLAVLGAAVAFAYAGQAQLAATALGGALGMVLPGTRSAPVPGLVFGLGVGALAGAVATG